MFLICSRPSLIALYFGGLVITWYGSHSYNQFLVFPKFHNLTFGLLQIKNTRYSGSVAPIFMHFGQEFSELCSFSFCYFYFGIWRRVTLYEQDNKCKQRLHFRWKYTFQVNERRCLKRQPGSPKEASLLLDPKRQNTLSKWHVHISPDGPISASSIFRHVSASCLGNPGRPLTRPTSQCIVLEYHTSFWRFEQHRMRPPGLIRWFER